MAGSFCADERMPTNIREGSRCVSRRSVTAVGSLVMSILLLSIRCFVIASTTGSFRLVAPETVSALHRAQNADALYTAVSIFLPEKMVGVQD